MFDPKVLSTFLTDLSQNNNKPWFDANREHYQSIRKALVNFVTEAHAELVQVDPGLANMNPRKSLFRINRDIRFSNDKTPYKTHWGAKFTNNGSKKGIAGYNIIYTAEGELLIMAGIHKIDTRTLNKIRDDLVHNEAGIREIIMNKKFAQKFPLAPFWKLKNCPRGYDKDSPYLEFLKLQSWWAVHRVHHSEWKKWDNKVLKKYILEHLAELTPFVQMINVLIAKKESS